jgi:hypothetical protein
MISENLITVPGKRKNLQQYASEVLLLSPKRSQKEKETNRG